MYKETNKSLDNWNKNYSTYESSLTKEMKDYYSDGVSESY